MFLFLKRIFVFLILTKIANVFAQIRNTRPSAGTTVDINQRVNFRVKTSTNSGSIQEVKFTFQNPNGDLFETNGRRRGNGYRTRRRLAVAGTWQWKVTVITSTGEEQSIDWRDIVAANDAAPTVPTPTAPTPTAPTPTAPTPTAPTPTSIVPIEAVANDIRALLDTDPDLGAKFVRLGFHMCVGGSCDGCVSSVGIC